MERLEKVSRKFSFLKTILVKVEIFYSVLLKRLKMFAIAPEKTIDIIHLPKGVFTNKI